MKKFAIQKFPDPHKELPPQLDCIPWDMLIPHELQALRNHAGQNLERLHSRGGLDAMEAVAILEDKDYRKRWPEVLASHDAFIAANREAIERLKVLCAHFCMES